MEPLDHTDCKMLLQENYWGHIAYVYDNKPFIIPITYYYDQETHVIIAYSAPGHKIDSMRIRQQVCFQVEHVDAVNKWQSVMLHGVFEELFGTEAKYELHKFAEGIKTIINQKENGNSKFISEFSSDIYAKGVTIVYRIKIQDMIGKQKDS